MKLHYFKILLFSLLLNILVKNKLYITPPTPTITSRVLNECDIYRSIYVKDEDMKSVKENFDQQTSQRFEEYEKRMIKKRKKCKEQCDKDIQEIILKDKMEKSIAEKVEKCCLMCGCGLGGVAAGVGIIGPVAVNEWAKAAMTAATEAAMVEGSKAGTKTGIDFGINYIITELKNSLSLYTISSSPVEKVITVEMLNNDTLLIESLNTHYRMFCNISDFNNEQAFCIMAGNEYPQAQSFIDTSVKNIVGYAKQSADALTTKVTSETIVKLTEAKTAVVQASSVTYNTAIIVSIVVILIIVLVMLIIYLILRYRRKKKMNKKAQYTKLLNQ
ncbi:rifin [Plasmodium sp. gorilla clade G1]|nr:rifin [Plasmodium sp. gorilla clade G1]